MLLSTQQYYTQPGYIVLILIVLATAFSTVCYKKRLHNAFSRFTLEYLAFGLYFLSMYTHLKACVYTGKIQVTCEIFCGLPLESIVHV